MTKFFSLAAAMLVLGAVSLRAQATVEYSALGDNIRIDTTTLAPTGDAVLFGYFPSGFDFSANQTFSSLSAAFVQLDSTTISPAPGHFDDSGLQTKTNQEFYIWAFNNPTPSSASAWLIVTNPSWTLPTAQAGDTGTFDTSDVGTFVPNGAQGFGITSSINNPAGNQTDWVMGTPTVVPEPSTYALLGCAAGVILLVRTRNKRTAP